MSHLSRAYAVSRQAVYDWTAVGRQVLTPQPAAGRSLEGEHWTTDVLGGMIFGCFWLVGAISAYHWVWYLREQRSLVQEATPSQGASWQPGPERPGLGRGT